MPLSASIVEGNIIKTKVETSMFQEKLRELMEAKSYISIYHNRDDLSAFGFGVVVACNGEHVIFAAFSPCGENDGLHLCEIDSICKIEYDDMYSNKMEKLINYNGAKHENYHFRENLIEEFLRYAKENNFIAGIEICDSDEFDALGLVDSLSDEGCKILLINQYGNENGYAEIKYSDITQMNCNECEERYRRILHQMQKMA